MEEKKFPRKHSSLWSVSNLGYSHKSFLRKFNLSSGSPFPGTLDKNHKFSNGFTLIELLVVIIILGVLVSFTMVALNPFSQIQKSQDAQREHDLKQLNSALDTFYNDTNCYPMSGEIPDSGSIWTGDNDQVYMQKVPIDPSAIGSSGLNYAYVTDTDQTDACPQWNVLFAKVANSSVTSSTLCPLEIMKDSDGGLCVPKNFNSINSRYNFCILSGNVDCNVIESFDASDPNSIPAIGVSGGSQAPTSTPIPTMGSGTCPSGRGSYPCSCSQAPWQYDSGSGHCNTHAPDDPLQGPGYCCKTGSGNSATCEDACTNP